MDKIKKGWGFRQRGHRDAQERAHDSTEEL